METQTKNPIPLAPNANVISKCISKRLLGKNKFNHLTLILKFWPCEGSNSSLIKCVQYYGTMINYKTTCSKSLQC